MQGLIFENPQAEGVPMLVKAVNSYLNKAYEHCNFGFLLVFLAQLCPFIVVSYS